MINLVFEMLQQIAPDISIPVDPDADLRDDLELDSIDVLNLLDALAEQSGVEVDANDYEMVRTPATLAAYLQARQLFSPGLRPKACEDEAGEERDRGGLVI